MEQEVPLTPEQVLEDRQHAREVAARTEQTQTLAIAGSTVFALLSSVIVAAYATGVWRHIFTGIGAAALAAAFWYTLVTYRERQLLAKETAQVRRRRAARAQERLPVAQVKKPGAWFRFLWVLVILLPLVFITLSTLLVGQLGLIGGIAVVAISWAIFAHWSLLVRVEGNKFDVYQHLYTGELSFFPAGSSWRRLFSKFVKSFSTQRQNHEYETKNVETRDRKNITATLLVVWTNLPCPERYTNSDEHVIKVLQDSSSGFYTTYLENNSWDKSKEDKTRIQEFVIEGLKKDPEVRRLGVVPGFLIKKQDLSSREEQIDVHVKRIQDEREKYLTLLRTHGVKIEEQHVREAQRYALLAVRGKDSGVHDYGDGKGRPSLFVSE